MLRDFAGRELAKREFIWFRDYLARPSGLLPWLFLYVAAIVANYYVSIRLTITFNFQLDLITYLLNVVAIVGLAYPWLKLTYQRTLGPFRNGRLQDLVLTELDPKSLWPSLLICPFSAVLASAAAAFVVDIWFVQHSDSAFGALPSTGHPLLDALLSHFRVYQVLANFFGGVGIAWGTTTFAVCITLPRTNWVRLVVCLIVGLAASIFAAEILAAAINGFAARLPVNQRDAENLQVFGDNVLGGLMQGIVGSTLGGIFLCVLRGRWKWQSIRRHAESTA